MGTKLGFSEAYHPQTDVTTERMIQTLGDMIRRYLTLCLEYKYKYVHKNDSKRILPNLEIPYNISIHSTKNKTLFDLETGFKKRISLDSVRNKNVEIHPTSLILSKVLAKARKFASIFIEDAVAYKKKRCDKIHKEPSFKIGDEVLFSIIDFPNFERPKKPQESFLGPFLVKKLVKKL